MAAFKIVAALFVVCIAQNVASAGLFGRDQAVAEDETQLTDTRSSGLSRGNPFGCMAHIPETYAVIQEFRVMWVKYQEMKENNVLLKAKCDQMEDVAAKEKCYKDADQFYSDESSKLVEQFKAVFPRVAELAIKFKSCLFD